MRPKLLVVLSLIVLASLATPSAARAAVPAPCDTGLIFRDGFEADGDAAWKAPATLAAARAASDGPTALLLRGAVVTYVHPAVGSDPAGFTVQATLEGPALFVAVDPVLLSPVPVAGDTVRFSIDQMATSLGMRRATAISGFSRVDQNRCLEPLTQEVSPYGDLVSNVAGYESERIALDAVVAGAFSASGTGFVSAQIDTLGVTGDTNLRLRVPSTLQDSIDLATGCSLTLLGTPLGRANAVAQPSAWRSEDLVLQECPLPRLLSALGTSTGAVLTFDRRIDPASITDVANQFVITGGAGVFASDAVVSGRTVTLEIFGCCGLGGGYTVTVAGTVTDLLGAGIDPAHNQKPF